MNIKLLQEHIRHFGLNKTIYSLILKIINRFITFKILRGMVAYRVKPRYLKLNKQYSHCLIAEAILRQLSKTSDYEISPDFLEDALRRGDECYGIFEGDKLISYGWYSYKPTEIYRNLLLSFSPGYIYMYKAFTHPNYRGQNLHPIGLNMSLQKFLQRGVKGLVAFAESHNYSSLNAGYKMGHKNFGNIYLLQLFGKFFIFDDKGCKDFNFSLSYNNTINT